MIFKSAEVKGQFSIIEAVYDNSGVCHRRTFTPLDDVSGEDQAIISLAADNHTQEIKDEYAAKFS
jgi:hypothetical protein